MHLVGLWPTRLTPTQVIARTRSPSSTLQGVRPAQFIDPYRTKNIKNYVETNTPVSTPEDQDWLTCRDETKRGCGGTRLKSSNKLYA